MMGTWIASVIAYGGWAILATITTISLILTVHLIWTFTHTESSKKAQVTFHALCVLLHIIGVTELTHSYLITHYSMEQDW